MTLTKADIIDRIYNNTDLTKSRATKALEDLLETIKAALENGEDVLITGFGKFCVKEKKERRGRNPATDEDLMLERRRIVTYRCSSVMRKRLNGGL
jgi:integration host factor subunit alpha